MCLFMWMPSLSGGGCAQEHLHEAVGDAVADSIGTDSVAAVDLPVGEDILVATDDVEPVVMHVDTLIKRFTFTEDSLAHALGEKLQERFIPDPKKAMWFAFIFPGGGQIYNRKYWKLPLVYGGFLGCVYALNWNNTMYRDYSQAYIDIMDSDENTKSYENFVPAHYDVQANKARLQELFRRKKNYYRRYRDLSMFCMIGVYALSIIDAYVDAELSSFDISKDLSMKVRPAVIHDRQPVFHPSGMNGSSYGLQCCLNF